MRTLFAGAISLAGALALVGCTVTAPLVIANVFTYHTLPETTQRTTYAFIPLDGQEGSLEYKAYQDIFRTHLVAYNYIEVAPEDGAEMMVAFRYGVGGGQQKVTSTPQIGQTGTMVTGSYAGNAGTIVSTPTYGTVGQSTSSRTVYGRELWFGMANAREDESTPLEMRYEGSVTSTGSDAHISIVIDELADALFSDFPGESGKARTEYLNGWN